MIGEQERKICALQAQLEEARKELIRIKGDRGEEGGWELAAGRRIGRKRTRSDSFIINTENRYLPLPELSGEEPQVERGAGNVQHTSTDAKKPRNVQSVRKKKVLLLGSSHGRGVGPQLQESLGTAYQATSIFKPNAGLSHVIEDLGSLCKDFTKEDNVVIVGGPGNSLDRDGAYDIGGDLDKIASLTHGTNVHFVKLFR